MNASLREIKHIVKHSFYFGTSCYVDMVDCQNADERRFEFIIIWMHFCELPLQLCDYLKKSNL